MIKKIFKEIGRFILVVLSEMILSLALSFIFGNVNPYPIMGKGFFLAFYLAYLPYLLLFLLFFFLYRKFRISKAWMIDTILALGCFISIIYIAFMGYGLSFFSNPQKHQYFVQMLEQNHNTPLIIPTEQEFDGMKRYSQDEFTFLEKENLFIDKNNQPITGVIVLDKYAPQTRAIFAVKEGKADGQGIWYKDEKISLTRLMDNGKFKKFQFFYPKGQIQREIIFTDDAVLKKFFSSTGYLMFESINDKENTLNLIQRTYDKNGHKNIEIDMIAPYFTCTPQNGKSRILTKEEIQHFFNELDKMDKSAETDDVPTYEPDVLCH